MSSSNITVDAPKLEDDLKAKFQNHTLLDPMQRLLLTGGALELLDKVPSDVRLRCTDDWPARQGDIVTLVERVVGSSVPRDPTRLQLERDIISSIEGSRISLAAPTPGAGALGPPGAGALGPLGAGSAPPTSTTPDPTGGSGGGSGASGTSETGGKRRGPKVRLVRLVRTVPCEDPNRVLWKAQQDISTKLGFDEYTTFIDRVFQNDPPTVNLLTAEAKTQLSQFNHVFGSDAYRVLKLATDSFIINRCGLVPSGDLLAFLGGNRALPYFDRILSTLQEFETRDAPSVFDTRSGVISERLTQPCMIELIWAYWMEQCGLVQSMKAVSLRFQNKRSPALRNPLDRIALDPLRSLNNLLWGFIEEESHQLSLSRRAYEYDNHYGLVIEGRAVEPLKSIDSRHGFIEAFHTLLNLTAEFYKELDDNTRSQDGFPLLHGLKEVHLILAQGMHNQWGDLPSQTRAEMLIQQWLLARPEMREFLGGRVMVPYQEAWMGRVETMRQLQGWGTKPINHFRDLAVFGEQLLLSIRFVDWIGVHEGDVAADWAVFWRSEVQTYIHAYRSLTGVDLTADVIDHRSPSVLLRQRA